MNNLLTKTLLLLLVLGISASACKDSGNDGPTPVEEILVSDIEGNTDANPGYTFYDLDAQQIIEDSTSAAWDIAFGGTTILANSGNNGGIIGLEVAFTDITEAPETGYEESNASWYNYTGEAPTGPQHAILAKGDYTLIVKTPEGKYAKVQILSYYQGNPDTSTPEFADFMTRPASRFFTFQYGLQTDGSRFFE